MPERKRTKAEERAYADLQGRLLDLEILELEMRNDYRKLKERTIPPEWRRIERNVPVRPHKLRVTASYDEDLVKWFRAMGLGYQARMNAVLRAYMLAVKSREIDSEKNRDWLGNDI